MDPAPPPNDWNLTNSHGYILDRHRSHAAASRLNLQHYLWKEALKYNIHPSILPSLPQNAAIADVACGTGMWLIDVSQEHPNAQLEGLDLVTRQAPHKNWLPSNVNMRYLNILEDVPDELIGRYDLVHTRLLVLVVQQKNPRPILRNLRKMLKPGGKLQWDELDTVNVRVAKADPKSQAPALEALAEWSRAEGRHEWTVQLPRFMAEEGFQDATIDSVGDRPELLRAFNEQHLLTAEEFAAGLVALGKTETASKYFRLVREAYEESTGGAALSVPRIVCVATKPV